jgi:small ligand-binding sensory domain FIST
MMLFGGGASNEYSTEEKVVGTWLDGKPIYQKTFQLDNIQVGVNTWTEIVSMPDAAEIVYLYTPQSSSGCFESLLESGKLWLEFNCSVYNLRRLTVLTVQYTKTTD